MSRRFGETLGLCWGELDGRMFAGVRSVERHYMNKEELLNPEQTRLLHRVVSEIGLMVAANGETFANRNHPSPFERENWQEIKDKPRYLTCQEFYDLIVEGFLDRTTKDAWLWWSILVLHMWSPEKRAAVQNYKGS